MADFKGRHFTGEVILWAVRWHLMFPVSYRDLELMLADRGVDRGGQVPRDSVSLPLSGASAGWYRMAVQRYPTPNSLKRLSKPARLAR